MRSKTHSTKHVFTGDMPIEQWQERREQLPEKQGSYQLRFDGWDGPTIVPRLGTFAEAIYSTWRCPHTPHCLHYTPCLQRYQKDHR
jgi:hypothetical protein